MDREGDVHERLRRLIAGDESEATWLYDSFAPALYRRLLRRYGRPGGPEVADLLHDAFVFFFQSDFKVLKDFVERFPRGGATELERHLWDLACGLASNRRRTSRRAVVVALADFVPADSEPPADRVVASRDTLARLDLCLRARSEQVYLYFKLRFFDGLSPEEIESVTGWPRKLAYRLRDGLTVAVRRCREQLGLVSP